MNSGKYIQERFQAWAVRNGIQLQGSAGDRGEPNYTLSVEENLFGGKIRGDVAASFRAGAGGELDGQIPTMSALHSSAAMAVNLFQHWLDCGDLETLARLLQVPSKNIESGKFEDQFPVCMNPESSGFPRSPHLDFALRYKGGECVGIECKLFEPYGRLDHKNLSKSYLTLSDVWHDLPACQALAVQLAEGPAGYHRLGPSQLLKHILGLKFGRKTEKTRLLYLYYDAPGPEAAEHRQEIIRFQEAIAGDPIRFVPMPVQEFIIRSFQQVREGHAAYADYVSERYL